MSEITFGTDGWRGIIADDYTFDNVRVVSQAVAEYLKRHELAGRGVAIGYDTRFLSGSFAGTVAEVMAANGIRVWLSDGFVPTPALSLAVRTQGAGGGVMITASHNPARWNGFKIKPEYGGSAPTEVTAEIEQTIPGIIANARVQHMALGEAEAKDLVDRIDIRSDYVRALREFVDMDAIRAAGLNVLIDSMYGASQGIFAEVIGDGATRLRELHGARNPSFPGIRAPEPIAANLSEPSALMHQGGFDVGLATDGDGDRFGLLDESGRFVTQLQTFALLVYYFLEVRGERGPIVRSVTMTRMVDRLGERFDCPVYETPVGFKFLGPKMMETDAMIAGEESGGFAFRGHIPERDGVLTGLYFLDWIARTGKRPAELLVDLNDVVGPHEYHRVDITLRPQEQSAVRTRIEEAAPKEIAGLKVEGRDGVDGFRFLLEGGWWLLMRFSGTEPLLRIYAEMPSMDQVHEALQAGQDIAGVSL
ncbi:MAG: phosphoglucomutase/phosphomannomutase family protein [Chloroflexi bacterium]|nr:phosphoglucomutase/phosphomannomutase family protein [Chloroflexota bacterium]MDA1003728.1 phosphoglucomutase/phosphomannomutase family protein [Chloroflexota bacterium]MQC27954.1 phosphoglucomutase/phosphomannomutase family protein [Chloroflexota bacterium]